MALKGWMSCVKYLLIVNNIIFFLLGLGILGVTVWMFIDTKVYFSVSENMSFFIQIYVLMGVAIGLTFIGFVGCFGAYHESTSMVGLYAVLVFLLFAAGFSTVVYTFAKEVHFTEIILGNVALMIKTGYGVQSAVTMAIDNLQRLLLCCGVRSAFDWADSSYNKEVMKNESQALSTGQFLVPKSCCNLTSEEECLKLTKGPVTNSTEGIFHDGCFNRVELIVNRDLKIIIYAGAGIGAVQVVVFLLAILFCCELRRLKEIRSSQIQMGLISS